MSLARGYRREIEGLPMRGGGIKDRIKNTVLLVGGKLLKIGSKTLAKKLKDSDNPVSQVAGTVMDTSDKPVTVVNKDAQLVVIQKAATALAPPPEPNMTKAPEGKSSNCSEDRHNTSSEIYEWYSQKRVKRHREGHLGNTGVKRRRKVTSLFINQ